MTSETAIALNQPGLKLERPENLEPPPEAVSEGDGETPPPPSQYPQRRSLSRFSLSITTNFSDEASRLAIYDCLSRISSAIDGATATHLSLMVKLVTSSDVAKAIETSAGEAGAKSAVRELPG